MTFLRRASEFPALEALRPVAPWCRGVLLGSPDSFQVANVHNVHMAGRLGAVDRARALAEWATLRAACEQLGLAVSVLEAEPDLPDLVFTANPCLVGCRPDGRPFAIASRMRHPERADEVELHHRWLRRRGVEVLEPPAAVGCFEGGGDGLWHPGRWLLWGGVGPRTDERALGWLSEALELPVATLRLGDPAFYHLDTCLAPLTERCAAWVPAAFDVDGRGLIERGFAQLIEVPDDEARTRLAANLWCPDGRHVLLPAGAPVTRQRLQTAGYDVQELPTDEYLKSGGSIYCMKQALPPSVRV